MATAGNCAICLCDMDATSRQLACHHVFHTACLATYMKQSGERASCPLCRTKIPTCIFACLRNGTLAEVELCLEVNPRLIHAVTSYWEVTPLQLAATRGDLAIVRLLVERGARVNSQAYMGHTPLYMAAMHGHAPVVTYLLDQGADPWLARNPAACLLSATWSR